MPRFRGQNFFRGTHRPWHVYFVFAHDLEFNFLSICRLQKQSGFFLKISKEIGKAWRKGLTRSLFSASFQTFCLTARAYLNTQKYGLCCSLINIL